MAKWIYERWTVQWNPGSFGQNAPSSSLHPYTINIGTLEVEERNPSVGEASIINPTSVSNYYSGELVGVRVYQGQSGSSHDYRMGSYRRNQLSALRIKGDRMPDIVLEEGTVPDDGIHTDGYWYVKVKALSSFVLKDGVWKPIGRHVSDGTVMAKWIYEKWTVKWDDSTLEGEAREPNSKIDPTTFVMSSSNDFFTGDLGAYVSNSVRSSWNSGARTVGSFILRTPSGYMYAGYAKSYNYEMWQYRVKDTLIETLVAEEGTVPDDGIHTNGYWYVKVKAVPGFVLKDGVWKPIEDMLVLKDGQWKNIE